jgi:DNA polymerase-3 subunit gamma/tau
MLGLTTEDILIQLLQDVLAGDVPKVLQCMRESLVPVGNMKHILQQWTTLLYQLAVQQMTEETPVVSIEPERLQLYYQISIQGQKDLPYAPNERIGFEMTILRLMAFQPMHIRPMPIVEPEKMPQEAWKDIIPKLILSGPERTLAEHAKIKTWAGSQITLILDKAHDLSKTPRRQEKLKEALEQYCGHPVQLTIELGQVSIEDIPVEQMRRQQQALQETVEQAVQQDPVLHALMQNFDAKIQDVKVK